jgi:hypothetical protein
VIRARNKPLLNEWKSKDSELFSKNGSSVDIKPFPFPVSFSYSLNAREEDLNEQTKGPCGGTVCFEKARSCVGEKRTEWKQALYKFT